VEIEEYNCLTEMCSGSEAGSYLRLIDFVYHSTLGLIVIKKKKRIEEAEIGIWFTCVGKWGEEGCCLSALLFSPEAGPSRYGPHSLMVLGARWGECFVSERVTPK